MTKFRYLVTDTPDGHHYGDGMQVFDFQLYIGGEAFGIVRQLNHDAVEMFLDLWPETSIIVAANDGPDWPTRITDVISDAHYDDDARLVRETQEWRDARWAWPT